MFGLADVGRVFLDGESSDRWHAACGGGIWLSWLEPGLHHFSSPSRQGRGTDRRLLPRLALGSKWLCYAEWCTIEQPGIQLTREPRRPAAATVIITFQLAGKATRDALFLSTFGVAALPPMVIAAAVLSMVLTIALARVMGRTGPGRLVPRLFVLSAVLLLAEWARR